MVTIWFYASPLWTIFWRWGGQLGRKHVLLFKSYYHVCVHYYFYLLILLIAWEILNIIEVAILWFFKKHDIVFSWMKIHLWDLEGEIFDHYMDRAATEQTLRDNADLRQKTLVPMVRIYTWVSICGPYEDVCFQFCFIFLWNL